MKNEKMKIAIIGAGNMGGAIARALANCGNNHLKIAVSDISAVALEKITTVAPQVETSVSNEKILENADIIVVAVKPYMVEKVAEEIRNSINYERQTLVSIAAGVDFTQLKKIFGERTILFRVIPNTAIEVLQSVSTISSCNATQEQEKVIIGLFSLLGKTFFVPENQLNALMSLSSCGIAYAFRYIHAVMAAGVELGIYPETAKKVVLQTLRGAIDLLEANNSHPEAEIDKVTTPAGITIKGLNEMEANGFTNAVVKGLKASFMS